MIKTSQPTRTLYPDETVNAALASVSRGLRSLDIAYSRISDMRKYPNRCVQDALALADLLEGRCTDLLQVIALLRHVAQSAIDLETIDNYYTCLLYTSRCV